MINNSDKLKLFASIRNSWPIFIIDEIFADDIFSDNSKSDSNLALSLYIEVDFVSVFTAPAVRIA